MDKRDLGAVFRERLAVLIERQGSNYARFAQTIGLDRSALSQLMSEDSTRLPRAETLQRIAESHQVSLDWLLGLSQAEEYTTEIAPRIEIEATLSRQETVLAQWHAEAVGYKIRYVPSAIPDLLRTPEVIRFEHGRTADLTYEEKIQERDRTLAYSRRPETDMEVCMPLQTLTMLAHGHGYYDGLSAAARHHQLAHMALLLEELYPTFRLFLYDGRRAFSAPYTVFGPMRAAIYVGEMYLVINSVEHIRALTKHFDDLIRRASVNPHEVADYVKSLAVA